MALQPVSPRKAKPEKNNHALLAAAFDSSRNAQFITEADTQRIIAANERALAVFELKPGGAAGMTLQSLPFWSALHRAGVEKLIMSGRSVDHADLSLRVGQLIRVFLLSVSPFEFRAQHLLFWNLRDISTRKRVEDELRIANESAVRLASRAEGLAALSQEALQSAGSDALLEQVIAGIDQGLDADICSFLELQPGGSLMLRAGIGWKPGEVGTVVFSLEEAAAAAEALRSLRPVYIEDVRLERALSHASLGESAVRTGMAVVVHGARQAYGVLEAYSMRLDRFGPYESSFLAAVANILGSALDRLATEEQIRTQQHHIQELSTPVLRVHDRLLVLPLIGALDHTRAEQVAQQLLASIRQNRARAVVLDLTGVPDIGTEIARVLIRMMEAARLLGARMILTGISRSISQTLVEQGIRFDQTSVCADLQRGLEEAELLLQRRSAFV